jgi:hypothetical protein
MKHINIKTVFYLRKFGLGITLDKMPMVFPFAYKLSLQIAWIECCVFMYRKSDSWKI